MLRVPASAARRKHRGWNANETARHGDDKKVK
jgi:hypothetical protein